MTRARNLSGLSTVTGQPTTTTPVNLGPLGVGTFARIYGTWEHDQINAVSVAATSLQVSGITTGLNVSGIITAQNGLNVNGNIVNGLNVSAGISTFQAIQATDATFSGTLTYEDLTNVDSIGVGTFRKGIIVAGVSTFNNNVEIADDKKLLFGTGEDLQLYHTTSDNDGYIKYQNENGHLKIGSGVGGSGGIQLWDRTFAKEYLTCDSDGAVTLFYNDGIRLATTNEGATLTGDITISDKIIHAGDTNTAIRFPAADTVTMETGGSETFRITGVGATISTNNSNDSELTIVGTGGATLHLKDSGSGEHFRLSANGQASLYAVSSDPMVFYTGGTAAGNERLRITSAGLVGIGSDNPDVKLTVCASSGDSYIRTIGGTNQGLLMSNSAGTLIGAFASGGALGGGVSDIGLRAESGNNILFSHGTTERARIDSSGRLLIGRTSAYASTDADNLIVGNEATNEHQGITILSHTGKYGTIYFGDGANPNGHSRGQIYYDHPNDMFRFGTAGTASRFTLDSSGDGLFTGTVTATNFVPTTIQTGHRNLWINGDMSVAQRMHCKGITSSADGGFVSMDRYFTHYSGGAGTTQWLTFTPGDERSGSKHYMRYAVTTASDYTCIRCPIEDVRTIAGSESITVSFDAKYVTNQPNGGLVCWFQQNYGESGTTGTSTAMQTLSLTTSWARYSLTFSDFSSMSGKTIGEGSFVEFLFGQGTNTSGSAWTLDITNLQIERGTEATPFEWQPVADTVARCQRYCFSQKYIDQRDTNSTTNNECLVTLGVAYTATRVLAHVYWPTTMRARPFVEFKDASCFQCLTSNGSWETSTSCSMRLDQNGGRLDITHGGSFTTHSAAEVRFTGSGDFYYVTAEMPVTTGSATGGVYS